MADLTIEQLQSAMPRLKRALSEAEKFIDPLNDALVEFEINAPKRQSAFLAQIAHESDDLLRWSENLSYSAQGLRETWPSRFQSPDKARALARKPEAIANYVYANRLGNGDEASGDGWRYRGRGVIQLTGRENYRKFGGLLGVDLEAEPDLAATPATGFRIAGAFWVENGLNALADRGDVESFIQITRRINGGVNGLEDRLKRWRLAKAALSVK